MVYSHDIIRIWPLYSRVTLRFWLYHVISLFTTTKLHNQLSFQSHYCHKACMSGEEFNYPRCSMSGQYVHPSVGSIMIDHDLPVDLPSKLPIYLPVGRSIHVAIYPSTYLGVYIYIYTCVCGPFYLPAYLPNYLSIYLFVYLSTYLSIYLSIYLSN